MLNTGTIMKLTEQIKSRIRDIQDYPKAGIVFKDITPVFTDPVLVQDVVKTLASNFSSQRIDAVAAIEARGFILGSILAHELKCSFIPIRKAGKLPYKTLRQSYALEYGSAEIEMHIDAVEPGWNVLVHDDLLATGGTACAAARLITQAGGSLAGFSFLINLGFLPGKKNIRSAFGIDPNYLIEY